jgi:hypothetical protein
MIPLHTLPTFSFFFSFFFQNSVLLSPQKVSENQTSRQTNHCMKVIFSRIPPHISWGSSSGPDSRPSRRVSVRRIPGWNPCISTGTGLKRTDHSGVTWVKILPSYQCLPGKKELEVICQFNTRAISVWIPHRYIPATLHPKKKSALNPNTRTGLEMNSFLKSTTTHYLAGMKIFIRFKTTVNWYLEKLIPTQHRSSLQAKAPNCVQFFD